MVKNNQSGFTLLEVLIAVAIMVIGFASILSVQSSSINASVRARQLNIVAMLTRNQMINTEFEIEGKKFEEVKKEDGAAFKAPYEDYRWTRVIKEIEFPNISFRSSSKGGESGGGSSSAEGSTDIADLLTKLLTQFLSKAAREVTVTVYWKKGSKEQSFSVTTYWVNLNHEFQLSQ